MVIRNKSCRCGLLVFIFFTQFLSNVLGGEPKLPAGYIPLPLVTQQTDYSCGPASYLSVLRYWNLFSGIESDLYYILKTSKTNGTNPKNIVRAANKMNLTAHYEEHVTIKKLWETWLSGETVILDLQAWTESSKPWKEIWADGHYIVMIGLDAEYLYAMDPSLSNRYGYLPITELYDRWHDFEEEENGKEWRNYQLAVFMKGKVPGKPFDPPPVLARIH